MKSDFNLTDAFKIFDTNYNGAISSYELRNGLNAIGLFPTQEEMDLFITRYDTTGDRRLNIREFSDAFLALDAYYARMAECRGSNHRYPVYRRDDCYYADTANQFKNVWRTHFRSVLSDESTRQRLARNPYFNPYEAFNSLDQNDSGCISREEFKRLIMSRGFYVSEKEATEIVEKMDKNKDGRVSFAEVSTARITSSLFHRSLLVLLPLHLPCYHHHWTMMSIQYRYLSLSLPGGPVDTHCF